MTTMHTMKRRNYAARIDYDSDDRIFVDRLAGIRDIVVLMRRQRNDGMRAAGKGSCFFLLTVPAASSRRVFQEVANRHEPPSSRCLDR
jgi:hypothetical protein